MVLFGAYVPAPPLQAPPVAPVTLPFRASAALLAQTDTGAPAFTIAAGVKLITMLSVTALHEPLPVVVSVSVTLPLAISAAVGV